MSEKRRARPNNSYARIAERAKALQQRQQHLVSMNSTYSGSVSNSQEDEINTPIQEPQNHPQPSQSRSALSQRAARLLERTLKREASVKQQQPRSSEPFSSFSSTFSNNSFGVSSSVRETDNSSNISESSAGSNYSTSNIGSEKENRRKKSTPKLDHHSIAGNLSYSGAGKKFHEVLERAKKHVGSTYSSFDSNDGSRGSDRIQSSEKIETSNSNKTSPTLNKNQKEGKVDNVIKEMNQHFENIQNFSTNLSELSKKLNGERNEALHLIGNLPHIIETERTSWKSDYEKKISNYEKKIQSYKQEENNLKEKYDSLQKESNQQISKLEQELQKTKENYRAEKEQNEELNSTISELKQSENTINEETLEEEINKVREVYEDKLSQAADVIQMLNKKIEEGMESSDDEPKVLRRALGRARKEIKDLRDRLSSSPVKQDKESNQKLEEMKNKYESEKNLRERSEELLEQKVAEYQEVLKEEKSLIKSLQQKLKRSEEVNRQLTEQVTLATSGGGDIPSELVGLYNELRGLMDPEEEASLRTDDSVSLADKANAQQTLIKMLLYRVKSERNSHRNSKDQKLDSPGSDDRNIDHDEDKEDHEFETEKENATDFEKNEEENIQDDDKEENDYNNKNEDEIE
eukprot:gb/GECH01014004.1/.p1 GENE.gb/GECH01014004.1/~~gb/GECH01014004.1/.p1  ORF type:complete len:634 (+),score=213.11 gb/GECH01014004.1/:1-1902(+)